ncbi:cytochrome c3 family protein, partial [Rhizobiaceae sp. 2RAB30]
PVEIALGLAAAIALSMTLAVRRSRSLRLYAGPLATLGLHRIAGTVACVAAGAHVALVAGMPLTIVLFLACGVAVLLAAGMPTERHVAALLVTLAMGTGAAAALAAGPLSQARMASLRASPVDHAGFSHGDHRGIACTTCHHNFVDRTGNENCITCHKRLSVSEPMRVDRMFHAFCSECHRDEKAAGHKTGPIDHCTGCHAN